MDTNRDLMTVKVGLAEMLRNGVIHGRHQCRAGQNRRRAGAVAVMALERCLRIYAPRGGWPGWPIRRLSSRLKRQSRYR